jgi:hypothetical protein
MKSEGRRARKFMCGLADWFVGECGGLVQQLQSQELSAVFSCSNESAAHQKCENYPSPTERGHLLSCRLMVVLYLM